MALTKNKQLHALLQDAIDLYQAGRLTQAIDRLVGGSLAFRKAARLWGYLGFLYSEVGDDAKAVQAFRKAVLLSPHSEQASLGLFHSLWRIDKVNAAFDEMRRFIKSNDSPRYRELLRDMLAEDHDGRRADRKTLVVA